MAQSLANRGDYQSAQALLERENIQVSLKKNSRWPELDLVSTLTLNGVDSRYSHSLQESVTADHPNWLIGLQFKVPLENRLARGEYSRAQLTKAKAVLQVKHAENQIRVAVDTALRDLDLKQKSLTMAKKISSLQREKWQSELKRYSVGKSSSDLVIRYHNDYLASKENYLQALLDLQTATLEYERVTNTIFERAL